MQRIGVVVHPTRPVSRPLETLRAWARGHDVELVQLDGRDGGRAVAPRGTVGACDLVVAIGGDGTTLAAIRAAAGAPVVAVACGSLGALTALSAGDLEQVLAGALDGTAQRVELPALVLRSPGGEDAWAVNDFAAVRRGTTQLVVAISVDGELYARIAGDGVIVATPLGSSAYSMAAGGPVVAPRTRALVCTPLARHGGCAPPLVVPAGATLGLRLQPGYGGVDFELDGRRVELAQSRLELTFAPSHATLLARADDGDGTLSRLRNRRLIVDSPRVLARDERETREPGGATSA